MLKNLITELTLGNAINSPNRISFNYHHQHRHQHKRSRGHHNAQFKSFVRIY